jgi:hypothetical protein
VGRKENDIEIYLRLSGYGLFNVVQDTSQQSELTNISTSLSVKENRFLGSLNDNEILRTACCQLG